MTARSFEDFRAAHDPTHEVLAPTTIFERPLSPTAKCFIVTAAQNATPVHPKWWAILRQIADANEAEILAIPLRYKNPTSQWTGSQQNAEHWAAEVRPFLWNTRKALNSNLTVLADLKIQPTASSPLTGADAISHSSSGIVGHTKVQLKAIPTPSSKMAKLLMTTGACTMANYTDSRSGRIGEFHHSLAAVFVIIDGDLFHARHIHYDAVSESCTDLDIRYTVDGGKKAPRPLALVMGDTHVDFIDPLVEAATFGTGGMVDILKPQHLIYHDLLDAYSCNPHHVGNPFNLIAKAKAQAGNVRAETERAIQFVADRAKKGTLSVVVAANHNDMLRRWMLRHDWKNDPTNAEFYLETALAMVRETRLTARGTEYPDPFTMWFERAKVPYTCVLEEDASFVLGGVELGMHGDLGPNGSRGSAKNLSRIGVKSIVGHSHSPAIEEGCYQVGTSTKLRLEYNHGPSSWLNAHAILHADGKRQLIPIIEGRWAA